MIFSVFEGLNVLMKITEMVLNDANFSKRDMYVLKTICNMQVP